MTAHNNKPIKQLVVDFLRQEIILLRHHLLDAKNNLRMAY
tara:strand:- start:16501 stop:16620 length:120 start_codon:yes stop_codon:yes gene_type:complete